MPGAVTDYERTIAVAFGISDQGRPADKWLGDAVRWAWRTRILLHLGIDIRVRLRTVAEEGAIGVFATNLRDILLAAPAGSRATMGLDPGLRTGVKVAVVDATGKVVATDVDLPARAAPRLERRARHPHEARRRARRRPHRDRQRHRLAGDRQARPRADRRSNPALKLTKSWCQRGRRLGVLRVGLRLARSCPTSTSRCAAPCRSHGGCRTRSPSW